MGKRHSAMASEDSYYDSGPLIPDDILEEIFLRLPGIDVVKSCTRVCKTWNRVANTQTLWKDKCARDLGFSVEMLEILFKENFKVLYFKNPYGRNLIKNPDASKGVKHWTVTDNRGDGIRVERQPVGTDPVEKFAPCQDNRPNAQVGCWATSYGKCRKEQIIDLVAEGCSPEVLDHLRPDINVSEWFSARFDCGIKYRLKVRLLKTEEGTPLDSCDIEETKPSGKEWYPANHSFSGYPPGVRYIQFKHGGQDTQFWAGNYGAKMTLSSVKFDVRHSGAGFRAEAVVDGASSRVG